MAFVAAMNQPDLTKEGVKGSDVYTEAGVGDPRVVLFTQLVRDQTQDYIDQCVEKIINMNSVGAIEDLIVMIFQTRDIRGGKGERDLFTKLMVSLAKKNISLAKGLVQFIPEYGSWRDVWDLWNHCEELRPTLDLLVKEQFELDKESQHPSLLVKWLPREGSKLDHLAKHYAELLFPLTTKEENQHLRAYRKCIANLNRIIDTTEIKMCNNHWADIVPTKVPGRLMKKSKLAFFNQKKLKTGKVEERFPENEDRNKCREHFIEFLEKVEHGEVKMKGADTTGPHEHVHEILQNNTMSKEQEGVIEAQWKAIREKAAAGGGLGRCVAMCDFSGSMDGVPKEVSFALGILVSELASPAFRDHILTFDTTPKWHSFTGKTTLTEKIRSVGSLGQGLSTNFQAACNLILQKMVEHNVPADEAPTDLIVFTDMGFDEAAYGYTHQAKTNGWQTHFQMIQDNFKKHGYIPPRIVCWNLRAEYKDFQAKAHEVGVVQLSGWSPALFNVLQEKGVDVQTPYQAMRIVLDNSRYSKIKDYYRSSPFPAQLRDA